MCDLLWVAPARSVGGVALFAKNPDRPPAEQPSPTVSAADRCAHLASHTGGDGGWTICMHVPDVQATTASVVAELRPAGASTVWRTQGSPCESPHVLDRDPFAAGHDRRTSGPV